MTDPVSNRPSGAEQAAQDAQRADQVRHKKTEGMATAQGAQGKKVSGQTKELKSSFDEMLKNLSEGPGAVIPQDAKFDSRLKEVQRDQDHSHSSDREKDDDKKPKDKADSGKKTKDTGDIGRERVVAKHQSGGGQQDSGKGSGGEEKGGQSGRGFQQKSQAQIAQSQSQTEELRRMQEAAPAPVPIPLQNIQQSPDVQAVQAPRELPRALMEQIISQVRVGLDKKLNKMMEIEFHDQVFNGLMLRVTSHGKEVTVEFVAPNRSVKECFLQEREKIAMALGEKGIDCRDILVTQR